MMTGGTTPTMKISPISNMDIPGIFHKMIELMMVRTTLLTLSMLISKEQKSGLPTQSLASGVKNSNGWSF